MKTRVAALPAKPLIIYDGDCRFCCRWIESWKSATGDKVEYEPSQDSAIRSLYPEISLEAYDQSVQLIDLDGAVYSGAEAIFRALNYSPDHQWCLWIYQNIPGFRPLTEAFYRQVAARRQFFSTLTRWFLPPAPAELFLLRSLLLRFLGLIYFFAFFSLATQIIGLSGEKGIVPAAEIIKDAREQISGGGFTRWRQMPTFAWWSASDTSLEWQCRLGVGLSLAVVIGVMPMVSLLMLWLLYLSLGYACDPFLGFQWDILLLETGLLAIFLAPLSWRLDSKERPSMAVIWLFRWLIFRLMFESGLAKIISGDPTWRDLTALAYHYETQPLPTLFAWFAHQWPLWLHKASVAITFIIELVLPFFVFAPWRLRWIAFAGFVGLQFTIIFTGNYAFFNLLTLLLSLSLLDDRMLKSLLPQWARAGLARTNGPLEISRLLHFMRRGRRIIFVPITLLILLCTAVQLGGFAGVRNWPRPLVLLYSAVQPFRSINSYGLFAVMTTRRPEIILEGSNDGREWRPYEFRYKPGDLQDSPGFVAPHQPRLDWQMWFAALGDFRSNPWFVNFCLRILEGERTVLKLVKANPFPQTPPKFLRARLYVYQFTTPAEKKAGAGWWKGDLEGEYLPPISLENFNARK